MNPDIQYAVDASMLQAIVVGGDLSKLTPAQRLTWYQARCEAAGLDPRTLPFQYLMLQGRLTLYATKTATDQLIAANRLTVHVVDRRWIEDAGLYEVVVRVTFPDGRQVEDLAAVTIAGLKGDAAANQMMKAVTKAKRRTVLSACGLGMLDETETDTIPGVQRLDAQLMNELGEWETAHKALWSAAKEAWTELDDAGVAERLRHWIQELYGEASSRSLQPEQMRALALELSAQEPVPAG